MKKIKMAAIAATLLVSFTLTACQGADVVAKYAPTSFKAVMDKMPGKVKSDEAFKGWALESPGMERFLWSSDFSATTKDVVLEFDATPFTNAGLDATKLPTDIYEYDSAANKIRVFGDLGADKFTYTGEPTPIDTFKKIVETHRKSIGYHEKLDHYGVALGNGNMFEWAKDTSKNDKDIVFVLNPKPFIDAGVDPAKVTGWAFAKVEIKNDDGKTEEVDKFLKPYELGK